MSTLNEKDKERVRYHLGYMATSSAPSMQLGIPRPQQTVFLLEQGLMLLTNMYAVNRVICILDKLDAIEQKLFENVDNTTVDRVGNLQMHPKRGQGLLGTDSLDREYLRWAQRLADVFGVPFYPFSSRFRRSGPGSSVNVSNS